MVDQATATQVQEALAPGGLEPATPSAAPSPVAVTPSPTEPAIEVTPSPAEATPKSTLGEQPKPTDGDQKASEVESHKDHMFLHFQLYINMYWTTKDEHA